VDFDISRAGFGLDIAAACFFELNVAGAGAEFGGTIDAVGANVARAAGSGKIAAEVVDGDVAGTAVEIKRNGRGGGDVVIDADVLEEVMVIGLADANGVAALHNGRVVNDAVDTALWIPEHGPAGMDVADDADLGVASRMEPDVAGTCGDIEVGLAGDVERALELLVCGKCCRRHRQEKRTC